MSTTRSKEIEKESIRLPAGFNAKPLLQVIAGAGLLLILFIIYVRYLENITAFVPSKNVTSTPEKFGFAYEDVTIKTKDNLLLNGWYIPSVTVDRTYYGVIPKSTLIFLHGNAGNIGDRLSKIKFFNSLGFDVLIFDYRGYGKSQGSPSESGIYLDGLAAYDYLMARKDIDQKKIVLYGESLGGAAAIDLASKRPVTGTIVDSSFSNAADMAHKLFPFIPSAFVGMKFDSATKAKKILTPKLFIHSTKDEVVPYDLGYKLYESAAEPKIFLQVTGSKHNDNIMTSPVEVTEALGRFLKEIHLYRKPIPPPKIP